ncbi:MAG: HAD-IIIA family hydrolase [Pelagibacteraceae bacterium TMED124]|nr:MAG: HAD-IIIA family hydrolase [Pelagibacteraceae bacterium TMED124]|tara:strand:- start:160 stop:1404 length:1245 start_codon:yes stop_codon:yes gene_type:complete
MIKKVINQAVITLGGKGTRLKSITKNIPKALFPIEGKSTLERSIENLSSQGLKKILLLLGNQSEAFIKNIPFLEKTYHIEIDFFIEKEIMGECGSLYLIKEKLEDYFIFLNGDLIFSIDLERLINFHFYSGRLTTLVLHTSSHPYDSDTAQIDYTNGIVEYKFKDSKNENLNHHLGNAGIAILSKTSIIKISKNLLLKEYNLFKSVFELFNLGRSGVGAYVTSEYIKDMGTPERFMQVKKNILSGLVQTKSYKHKQSCLFIDRDNTLNYCKSNSYILDSKEIKLIEKNVEKIAKLSKNFSTVIIISNQPQISMSKCTFADVYSCMSKTINLALKKDLFIDRAYFCPHHQESGFPEEEKLLKINCFCRKPSPGLFFQAIYDNNIDINSSIMIGDSYVDKSAAKNVGIDFIKVNNL